MPKVTKQRVLELIKATAAENDGEPLGVSRFETATGIRESDWRGVHWAKWSDAVAEAGFAPNPSGFSKGYDDAQLLAHVVTLVRTLRRFPSNAELRLRANSDAAFPDDTTFRRRFGNKLDIVRRVLDYAKQQPGHEDVVAICEPILRQPDVESEDGDEPTANEASVGEVYLLKSGKHYKIGRTNSVGRRGRELEIQLPEKATVVHSIRTDDPVGIEAYWHRRFADRRLNGEWFALTAADVSAFRRRKGFM